MKRDPDKTPADTPLARLVLDTPSRPMRALDNRLSRFVADLDSVPPPPHAEAQRQSVEGRMRQMNQSGTWELEALLASTVDGVKAVAARQMAEELERRLHIEKELEDRVRDGREFRNMVVRWLFAVSVIVAGAIAVGIIGFTVRALWQVSHEPPSISPN